MFLVHQKQARSMRHSTVTESLRKLKFNETIHRLNLKAMNSKTQALQNKKESDQRNECG